MRMIDADALEKEGWRLHRTIRVDKNTSEYQTKSLKQIPTIEERKTGRWIKKDCDLLYCSECDLPSLHPWPYCERCGAKMEVEHDSQ